MKVVYLNSSGIITLLPREIISNINNLSLFLTSEFDDNRLNYSFTVNSYVNGVLKINTNLFSSLLELGKTYKLELLELDKIVYLGKLIVVDENTDVQNYSRSNQSNSIFK